MTTMADADLMIGGRSLGEKRLRPEVAIGTMCGAPSAVRDAPVDVYWCFVEEAKFEFAEEECRRLELGGP
jgi:hypothetical protein